MDIKESFQNARHILYRLKVKVLYNSSYGKRMRSYLWQVAGEEDGFRLLSDIPRKGFAEHTLNNIKDEYIRERFTWETTTYCKQSDRLYEVTAPVIIEPANSLAFTAARRRFVLPTRSKAHYHLTPNLLEYKLHNLTGGKYTYYPALIHLDGFVGRNIYHFFDEAINPLLHILKNKSVDLSIPLLINEQVYKMKYVQYVLNLPAFSGLKIIVQKKGEWIKTDHLYKCVTGYDAWDDVYELFSKLTPKNPSRRVFLNRKPEYQRRLLNNEAIESIVKKYGFEVVYAEDMTYAEQVKLFADIKYFVSMHGGGVTNVIHSDLSQLGVIELFPKGLLNPHYYLFLEALSVKYYDAILGSELDTNWNYSVDEKTFEERLVAMLESA
jgi:hypothetical protein